jgi:molecular chaperone HscA
MKDNSENSKCCNSKENQVSSDKILHIGIDFGTTNCLISYFDLKNSKLNSEPELKFIRNQKTSCNFFSSLISLDESGKYFFCSEASSCSPNLKITKSIKRIIGMKLSEVNKILDELSFEIDFEKSSEENIFVFIGENGTSRSVRNIVFGMMKGLFSVLLENNETKGFKVFKAVITVPAYFDESSRIIIKEAAIFAGFEVLKLINEPTAAALMYMQSFMKSSNDHQANIFKKNENYLVYDFGGGTFDVSVLRSHNNDFFRVIGIGGDKYLGGDDLDFILSDFVCKNFGIDFKNLSMILKNKLLSYSKKFKEEFDSGLLGEMAEFYFCDETLKNQEIKLQINREIFDQIFEKIIEKTIKITLKTLKDIDLSFNKLSGIILVGGSSRLKLIKSKLQKIIQDNGLLEDELKILDFFNPDEVVAAGAGLYSLNLNPVLGDDEDSEIQDSWKKNFKQYFIDAISQNLGIEIGNGLCEFLIPKNSPIPITTRQVFSNQIDNQKVMRISICQGESKFFKENIFLGEFFLENLPSAGAGELQIEISFSIDCDGILSVFAKILNHQNDVEGDGLKTCFIKIQ